MSEPEPDSYDGLMKRGYWERAVQVADAMLLRAQRAQQDAVFSGTHSTKPEDMAVDYWLEQGDRAWRALQLGYDDPKGRGWRV